MDGFSNTAADPGSNTVETVLGPVDADELGIVLPHEHLFIDLTIQFHEPEDASEDERKRAAGRQKVGPANIDALRCNPYAVRDNLLLDDMETAVSEVAAFRDAGGGTIVDCSSIGIRGDIRALQKVSRLTGVRIVAGCGYYTADTHPPEVEKLSTEQLAESMVHELVEGIGNTGIKAGVIGEIGTGNPILPSERKALTAAAMASCRTGAGIQVHTYPWERHGTEAADVLIAQGVRPHRIAICHTDVSIDLDYMRSLLGRGVYLEFDNFGKEFAIPTGEQGFAGGPFGMDGERIQAVVELVRSGYERQLLLTNDICLKCMLGRYGGGGYEYVLTQIAPRLAQAGISQQTLDLILRENPRRFLASALA